MASSYFACAASRSLPVSCPASSTSWSYCAFFQ